MAAIPISSAADRTAPAHTFPAQRNGIDAQHWKAALRRTYALA
jgi:hypothetical protein